MLFWEAVMEWKGRRETIRIEFADDKQLKRVGNILKDRIKIQRDISNSKHGVIDHKCNSVKTNDTARWRKRDACISNMGEITVK